MSERYSTSHLLEDQYEPGSDGKVLRNLLGITDVEELGIAETEALWRVQEKLIGEVTSDQSFRAEDICEGNGRLGRLLATLMALQAGLPLLDFTVLDGLRREEYFAAVRAGLDTDYDEAAVYGCYREVLGGLAGIADFLFVETKRPLFAFLVTRIPSIAEELTTFRASACIRFAGSFK